VWEWSKERYCGWIDSKPLAPQCCLAGVIWRALRLWALMMEVPVAIRAIMVDSGTISIST